MSFIRSRTINIFFGVVIEVSSNKVLKLVKDASRKDKLIMSTQHSTG